MAKELTAEDLVFITIEDSSEVAEAAQEVTIIEEATQETSDITEVPTEAAPKKKDAKKEDKKKEDKKVAAEEKKEQDKSVDVQVAPTKVPEVAASTSDNQKSDIVHVTNIRVYSAPSTNRPAKSFSGNLKICGKVGEFTVVSYVKSGFGPVVGYTKDF